MIEILWENFKVEELRKIFEALPGRAFETMKHLLCHLRRIFCEGCHFRQLESERWYSSSSESLLSYKRCRSSSQSYERIW